MHTLSLQMPVLATDDYLAYAVAFPDAYKTLKAAVAFVIADLDAERVCSGLQYGRMHDNSVLGNTRGAPRCRLHWRRVT